MLITGHILTEVHSIVRLLNKQIAERVIHPFPLKDMGISIEWYLKQLFDTLLVPVILFSAAKGVFRPSFNLFVIFYIYFCYGFIDLILLMVNYKQGPWKYYLLLVVSAICVYLVIHPLKKKMKCV